MLNVPNKQFKFVLVGDSAVGKSSLLNRFVDKTFNQSLMSTIGVDFKFKKIKIDNQDIKLQIWDTAGQQTFRSIVSAYYASADAIVIVYDITSYASFQSIKEYWIEEAENNNKNNAKIFMIGNKNDQQTRREVEKFSLQTFMEEHSIEGNYQASAKTGTGVEDTFINIARVLFSGKSQVKSIRKQPRTLKKQNKSLSNQIKKDQNQQEKQAVRKYSEIADDQQNEQRQKQQNSQNKRQNNQRIKINVQPSKPKNPNYNKGCCLK